jgi:tetratricopeptide (TPR) repeat protein
LSGISNQYDDPHCQKLQLRFAWRVPAAAEFLEVNGERLPISGFDDLRNVRAPYLFLPRGRHAIRLRLGEQPIRVEIEDHLASTESAMRGFFDVGGKVRRQDLLARGARAMDVHGAPFLLNMMGAAFIADDEWAAAERKFRRSLAVNPFFGPAHLNLAVCLFKRNAAEAGIRELRLADALNVGNVFGLSGAITKLRRQHDSPESPEDILEAIPLHVARYVSPEPLTLEDERLTALMTALAKYAVREEDRGKILNNLAIHFSETGKAETALEHFRSALAALKLAGPERFALAEKVLSHMETACRKSNFPEAEEYAFMRKSVLP